MKARSVLSCLLLGLSLLPWALSQAHAISEENFEKTYAKQVRPFFERPSGRGYLTASDGHKLHYRYFDRRAEKGAIVIAHGAGETLYQYRELAYDLWHEGYSFYVFDQRGHGLSDRLLPNREIRHVERFQDYVSDLKRFVDQVVRGRGRSSRKVYLFGHSMGGAVAALFLERYAGAADGAVLVTPMHQINLYGVPESLALWITHTARMMGRATAFSVAQGPWEPLIFGGNLLSSSKVRMQAFGEPTQTDERLRVGGGSNQWVHEAILATRELREKASNAIDPVLLLQAGQDLIVKASGQRDFCDRALDCRLEVFPEAKHGVLNEVDAIRDDAMGRVLSFLESLSIQ